MFQGRFLDLFGFLGLHHIAGTFFQQIIQRDSINDIERVKHITLGFGHFLPVGIPYQAVDIDFLERHIIHEFQAHHDHSGHPEENNVESGHQYIARVKSI